MTAYGGEIADLYDFVHMSRGKDYTLEADTVLEVAARSLVDPRSVLDVACGTGHHLAVLARTVPRAVGFDLSEDMCGRAASTYPHLTFRVGDMRSIRLGETFDLVTCLFSAIGHMATVAELTEALVTMREHLAPGGVCIVDPWWAPEQFLDGHVSSFTGRIGDATVTRVSHSSAKEGRSIVAVDYLVTSPDAGTRHLHETHEISMFSYDEYLLAFGAAGLDVELSRHGSAFPRGLYVARHANGRR